MLSCEPFVSPDSHYYNYTPSTYAKSCLLYVKCIGLFSYRPGYVLERTSFDSFLLEVILDGAVTIETDGQTLTAGKGSIIFMDCYKPHRYYSEKGWKALWLHFDGPGASGYYNWLHHANNSILSTSCYTAARTQLMSIYQSFHQSNPPEEAQTAAKLAVLFSSLLETPSPPKSREQNRLPEQILYYINEHIDEDLTVSKLAQMAHFSTYHFIRVFHTAVGMTPRQYIITTRMDHAKYLLKFSSLPLETISARIGYTSSSVFCIQFKRHCGLTPSEYRKNNPASSDEESLPDERDLP